MKKSGFAAVGLMVLGLLLVLIGVTQRPKGPQQRDMVGCWAFTSNSVASIVKKLGLRDPLPLLELREDGSFMVFHSEELDGVPYAKGILVDNQGQWQLDGNKLIAKSRSNSGVATIENRSDALLLKTSVAGLSLEMGKVKLGTESVP